MNGAALGNITKRVSSFLPLVAALSGVAGSAVYYMLRRSQVVTLQYYGLDSALVSTPFSEIIADGLSTIAITFLLIIGFNRLSARPVRAAASFLIKIPAVKRYRDDFRRELQNRSTKAATAVTALISLSLCLILVFIPLALARWHISRANWLVDANLCQHYCFSYQLIGKEPPVIGLPIAVGSSRLIVISANHRAHLLDAQSLRVTVPFEGKGQKALPHAPLSMRGMWLILDAVNGDIRGLWDHAWS